MDSKELNIFKSHIIEPYRDYIQNNHIDKLINRDAPDYFLIVYNFKKSDIDIFFKFLGEVLFYKDTGFKIHKLAISNSGLLNEYTIAIRFLIY